MTDKPNIMMASNLIHQLEAAVQKHGDLPVDLSVDYEGHDNTFTARGPLDCDTCKCEACDWARHIYPARLLISSSGFLINLACIPE